LESSGSMGSGIRLLEHAHWDTMQGNWSQSGEKTSHGACTRRQTALLMRLGKEGKCGTKVEHLRGTVSCGRMVINSELYGMPREDS
jgi:hypothetical protein